MVLNVSQQIYDLLMKQISHELHNAQVYKMFSNKLGNVGLSNLSKRFYNQSKDEQCHQEWLIEYCGARNLDVDFIQVNSVNLDYNTVLDIAEIILELEITTTNMLKNIAKVAFEEMDYLTYEFIMNKMINEQRAEEEEAQTLVDCLTNIGDNMALIQLYDNSL